MASVATRAGAAAAARRPPLIADRCLRTQLISSIAAPQASSERVSPCFSTRRMPGAGLASRAEPPPEARQTRRSSAPRPGGEGEGAVGGGDRGFVRHRMAGLHDFDRAARRAVAVAGHGEPVEGPRPVRFEYARHLGRRLAETEHRRAPLGRSGETARQHLSGRNRRERGVEQQFQRLPQLHRHRDLISDAGGHPKRHANYRHRIGARGDERI